MELGSTFPSNLLGWMELGPTFLSILLGWMELGPTFLSIFQGWMELSSTFPNNLLELGPIFPAFCWGGWNWVQPFTGVDETGSRWMKLGPTFSWVDGTGSHLSQVWMELGPTFPSILLGWMELGPTYSQHFAGMDGTGSHFSQHFAGDKSGTQFHLIQQNLGKVGPSSIISSKMLGK